MQASLGSFGTERQQSKQARGGNRPGHEGASVILRTRSYVLISTHHGSARAHRKSASIQEPVRHVNQCFKAVSHT